MIAALLALALQQQTITFTHPCANSAVVLAALGKKLGVNMEPSGSVKQDYFLVSFHDVPEDVALKKIADTLNATWEQKDGVTYLTRGRAQEVEAQNKRLLWLQTAIEDYVSQEALTLTEWSSERVADSLRKFLLPSGELDRDAASAWMRKNGPNRQYLDEFVKAVGAKALAALPDGTQTVFRWNPDRGDRRIPQALAKEAQTWAHDIAAVGEGAQSIGVPLLGDFDLPAEVRLAEIGSFDPRQFAFTADRRGSLLTVALTANSLTGSYFAMQTFGFATLPPKVVVPGLEGDFHASDLADAIASRTALMRIGRARRADPDAASDKLILDWFADGLDPEPLDVVVGRILQQTADATGRNIVALVDDAFMRMWPYPPLKGAKLSDVLGRSRYLMLDVKSDGAWITTVPPTGGFGVGRIDRPALARLALDAYKNGWPTIDMVADFASHCDSAIQMQTAQDYVDLLLPAPRNYVWLMNDSSLASLKAYDSLPTASKELAKKGEFKISVADLPGSAKDALTKAVVGKGFAEERDGLVFASWSGAPLSSFRGDAQRTAADLDGAVLGVRVERDELLTTQDVTEGNHHYYAGPMSPEAAAQTYLSTRDDTSSKLDFGTLAQLTYERLTLRLTLRDGTSLLFQAATNSQTSETRYYPVSQLPGDFGDRVRSEIRRLGGSS